MKTEGQLGSMFEALSEPTETYREGCFNFQKWFFDTDSKDIKWMVIRREFITLNEQVFEWLDKFPISETIRCDAKRLIWETKYEDYKSYHFSSPLIIALCAMKLSCDFHKVNFYECVPQCIEVAKKELEYKKIIGYRLQSNYIVYEIKRKAEDLKKAINWDKRIEEIQRMWGCIDEAALYGN